MGQDAPKKIAIIAVSSLLLVVLVVALLFVSHDSGGKTKVKASASQKAITAICQTTDYQDTCFKSLDGHNSSDPKQLIQAAIQATIDYIKVALHNSTTLKQAQTDPRARAALDACGELGNRAINDLNRSFSKFSQFDITNVDDILLELKTWISGAMTHQETCLDGFEKLNSNAGARMKQLLTTSMEMTSNALAMVAEISTFLESMGVQGHQQTSSSRRRLLSQQDLVVAEHGSWVDAEKRRLLAVQTAKIRPNIIVAKDGSGKFKTINEALHHIPKHSNKTFVLYIKEGIYAEQVQINTSYTHLMIIGDGPTKTRITGSLNFVDGVGTYQSATVAVQGDDFIARDIAFENSAGAAKLQAVALRASSDKSIYYNCHIEAYQDTLYTHAYRQFYKDCVISGTIDFIFGDSAAIFQGCMLLFRKPLENQQNIVTAQGRLDVRQPTALVLQNCTFKADPELQSIRHKFKSYLGRPWKEYSRTIIMESFLDDFIHPDGWMPWDGTFAFETLFYTEFNNRGPASPKAQRVKWPGVKELPPNRIKRFTAAEFLDGNRWIPQHRVPYAAGFIFPVPNEDPNIKYSPVSTEETKDLGSTAERKNKKSDSNNNNKGTGASPPPPSPSPPTTPTQTPTAPAPATPTANPPASTPKSSIAAPPTLAQQVPVGAASPSSLGAGTDAVAPVGNWNTETGELIIDLSPAPAPAPTSTSDISEPPILSPAASPRAASPSTTPALSPTAASPATTPVSAASPSKTPALSPMPASPAITPVSGASPSRAPAAAPQSSAAAVPSFSPKGSPTSTPPPNAAAPSPSGGSGPRPQRAATASPTGAPQSQ